MLSEAALSGILTKLPEISIALVGDLFLDKYLDLDASLTEISIETGLDAYQVFRIRCYAGAGGTVLNNLRALGIGNLRAISIIGDDGEGYELLRALRTQKVDVEGVVLTNERMTGTYTKPMLSQAHGLPRELNRIDIQNRTPPSAQLEQQVIAHLDAMASQVDAIIVADQMTERNRGVITDNVRAHLAVLAERHRDLLIFGDSRAHPALFRGCVMKPNRNELFAAMHADQHATSVEAIVAAARELETLTGKAVYVTRGADGILYVQGDTVQEVPGVPVTGPIDICGAGDSTTAGIVSGLCAGASPFEAAELGCLVASLTIQQIGVTGTASPADVLRRFRERQERESN